MKVTLIKLASLLILLACAYYVSSTLSKAKKKKSKDKSSKVKLAKTNVLERGLVNEEIEASDVVENHAKYCEKEKGLRRFTSGDVLGYVTPWNSHGYDVAKTFSKFSMISPVWLQIKRKPRGKFHVTGTHDIDKGWVKDVRKANTDVQILPRVLFDNWSLSDYKALFLSEDEIEEMIETMMRSLNNYGFDGAVIEIWSQMPSGKSKDVIHVLEHMSKMFREKDLSLILVIPPSISPVNGKSTSFTREHFTKLAPLVDAFSIMTYDFSVQPGKAGPNSPVYWMKACVENLDPQMENRHKILLGLNFYGYLFSPQGAAPVIGEQFIKVLETYPSQFVWQTASQEHVVEQEVMQGQRTHIVYPTLKSIHTRLELAQQLGTGIAIWEIGQGLDYFYDLL